MAQGATAPKFGGVAGLVLLFVVIFVVALLLLLANKNGAAKGGPPDGYEGGAEYFGGTRTFRLAVREPYFEEMVKGKKTVVGRLRTGAFAPGKAQIKAGSPVIVARSRPKGDSTEYPGIRRYRTTVVGTKDYRNVDDMEKGEKGKGVSKKEFTDFYSEEDLKTHGVLAIQLQPPTAEALKPPVRK